MTTRTQAFWGWGALVVFLLLNGLSILAVYLMRPKVTDTKKTRKSWDVDLSIAQWSVLLTTAVVSALAASFMIHKAHHSAGASIAESFKTLDLTVV